jgi:phytanoyl-CoA hydroxylase
MTIVATHSAPSLRQDGFTPDEIAAFGRDGFVLVRDLADESTRRQMLAATLDGLGREIEPIEFEADVHYPGAPQSRDARGGRTTRRLKQAHSRHPVFSEWVVRPELLTRLQQLLGPQVAMPLAHHNCIMTKQPQYSSDTGWHQDVRYWSFARPELVSVWLALGHETRENGCLRLIPGSHAMDFERDRLDDAVFFKADDDRNRALIETQVAAELRPGDVLFFHARTLHAATRNFTADAKFSVVFTFRPLDNPPLAGTRSASLGELLLPAGAPV